MKRRGLPKARVRTSLARLRRGFSLLELFLVIAILSVIALLTFPMLRRPLNESIVQDAGQQLLRELAAARTSAIESGRPLLFQYQTGSGRYYIGTQDQRFNAAARSVSTRQTQVEEEPRQPSAERFQRSAVAPLSGPEPGAPAREIRGELPGDVSFFNPAATGRPAERNPFSNRPASVETGRERQARANRVNEENLFSAERSSNQPTGSTPDDLAPESMEWSAPIHFYPSGRTKPAKVPLLSREGFAADVEIRGLAGRFRLSPLRRGSADE